VLYDQSRIERFENFLQNYPEARKALAAPGYTDSEHIAYIHWMCRYLQWDKQAGADLVHHIHNLTGVVIRL
jgi:hypothetical protein